MQSDFKIVYLAGNDPMTRMVLNAIESEFPVQLKIIETHTNKMKLIRRRIKRLGIVTVFGQLVFQVFVVRLLRALSKKRIAELEQEIGFSTKQLDRTDNVRYVGTVNDAETIALLQEYKPDLVLVNGTRIISKKVLAHVQAPIVNMHVGITPRYRGVHGMYWALYNRDAENAGVTIHYVDAGIDTGQVLAQARVKGTNRDNFVTYGYIQLAAGIGLLRSVIASHQSGSVTQQPHPTLSSKLWYHPTLWQYLWGCISRGVK